LKKAVITMMMAAIMFLALSTCNEASEPSAPQGQNTNTIFLHIGNRTLTATLTENPATRTLRELLAQSPITIDMRDFGGFEKVGNLATHLPTNDQRISTVPGDIMLFRGNQLVIFYAPHAWSYTRIGRIDDITQAELIQILGPGNVTVKLSLTR